MKWDGSEMTPITRDNGTATSNFMMISPDYKKVVFTSTTPLNGSFDGTFTNSANVWVANVDGTSLAPLTSNSTSSSVLSRRTIYSPDGNKILYSSYIHPDSPDTPNGTASSSLNIFIMNSDGSNKLALTRNTSAGYDSDVPRFTRDGKKVLFYSTMNVNGTWNSGASSSNNIFSVNADGSELTALTKNTGASQSSRGPTGSTDGTKIVFSSFMSLSANANSWNLGGIAAENIWMMNIDGSNLAPLTVNTSAANLSSTFPVFNYSGTRVLFSSQMDISGTANGTTAVTQNIWSMSTDGTDKRALTRNTISGADSQNITGGSDGQILFQSLGSITPYEWNNPVLSWNIWVANEDGTNMRPLTKNTLTGFRSWKYDGWSTEPLEKCI